MNRKCRFILRIVVCFILVDRLKRKGIKMRNDLLVKKELSMLRVFNGLDEKFIASEIVPMKIGSHHENRESWENGPTTYHRWDQTDYWLIRWNGQHHIIAEHYEAGDYSDKKLASWKVVAGLPTGLEISESSHEA